MESKIHETRLEYYIKNPFYKISKIRYDIKKVLSKPEYKKEFYEEIKIKNGSYDKAIFSFCMALLNDKKNQSANRLLVVKIRSKNEISDRVLAEFKKIIETKEKSKKRPTPSKKHKNGSQYKENRSKMTVEKRIICLENTQNNFYIQISSPMFLKKMPVNTRNIKSKFSKKEKSEIQTEIEKLKEEIIKTEKENIESQIKTLINKRYTLDDADFKINLLNFDQLKIGYVSIYKANKYKPNGYSQKLNPNEYISKEYCDSINDRRKKYMEISQKTQKNPNENKYFDNYIKTNVKGIYNFEIEFEGLPQNIILSLMLHGVGGKAGLGMGYLHCSEKSMKKLKRKKEKNG